MIINEFIILDYVDKTSLKLNFSSRQNIIIGKKNKIGKSSIVKSIYFTMGYDNKTFMPDGWNYRNMKYKITYTHNQKKGYIIRHQDLFYVDNREEPLNEKEYRKWFQELLGISYKLKPSNSEDEIDVYASAILMPFYIDQDISWNDAPYKSPVMGMYGGTSYRSIFEKLFSISNDDILALKQQVKELGEVNKRLSDKINVLEELIEEQTAKSNSIPYKDNYFDKQEEYLDILKRVSAILQQCENEKLKRSDKINQLFTKRNHLNQIIKQLKKKQNQLQGVCQYCGSQSSISNLSDRLMLLNNLDDIQYQIDIVEKDMAIEEERMKSLLEREKKTRNEYKRYMDILKENPDLSSIEEYIENSAENLASDALIQKNEAAISVRQKNIVEIEKLNAEIRELDKARKIHLAQIEKKYNELFLEIISNKLTSVSNYGSDKYPFLSFKRIPGSGTDTNIKKYLIYLVYFNLLDTYSEVRLPFLIDSFIRTEIDGENHGEMFSAITKYFLELSSQTFFTVLQENVKFINGHEQYYKIYLNEKPILKADHYEEHRKEFLIGNT